MNFPFLFISTIFHPTILCEILITGHFHAVGGLVSIFASRQEMIRSVSFDVVQLNKETIAV